MKVSDECHCGVNTIVASRTGLVQQPKSDKSTPDYNVTPYL